jgi:hypothetical protein
MVTYQSPTGMGLFVGIWLLITTASLPAQEANEPTPAGKQDQIVPLPIHASHPEDSGLFLTFGRETRICRLPGRNQVEKIASVIADELERNSMAAMIAKTKAAKADDQFEAAILGFVARHVAESGHKPGPNREALCVGGGWKADDGAIDSQDWIQQENLRMIRCFKLRKEPVWSSNCARAFRITGTCADQPMQSKSSPLKKDVSIVPTNGRVSRIRYEHYIGTFGKLGAFALTFETGFTSFDRKGWLPTLDWHLDIGLNWYEAAGICVQWEIDVLRSTLARRILLSL